MHFCPDFLVMYKNGLIRKLWLISNFITSQNGQQVVTDTYPISQEVKTIKFVQLIEHNMKNIFLEKSHTK